MSIARRMSMSVLMAVLVLLFMNMFIVMFVVVVMIMVVRVLVNMVVAVLVAVLMSMLVVVVMVVSMLMAMLSIASCCVVLMVDGTHNGHRHGMRHWDRERDSLVGVHPVQPMSDNRGDHGVVPSIPSMMITTYAIAPLIGLLWLGIALLWVDSLFWLVRSWSQLSVGKRQHLKLVQDGVERKTSPARSQCRHTGPGRLAGRAGTGLPGLTPRSGVHLLG